MASEIAACLGTDTTQAEQRPAERSSEGRTLRKSAKTGSALPAPVVHNSKEAILSAALKAFARDGYGGASMPQIAKMAKVAPPLIHYYFGSKENLWRETVEYSLGELRREASAVRNATRALAPLDRLRALLQVISQFAAHWPDHFAMFIAEARSDSDRFAWIQKNFTGSLFDEIVTLLKDARDGKAIKDVDFEQLACMLLGGSLIYFTVQPELLKGKDLDTVSGEFTELMFRTLLDGVALQ